MPRLRDILIPVLLTFSVGTAALDSGIVTEDRVALRAAPRLSAQQHAVLWQGDLLEIRGERLDFLQVYDHRRERGGYVHASLVKRSRLAAEEAPDLLAIARFLRDKPGREALGIALIAAYLKAAPGEELRTPPGIDALLMLGTFAARLADRASAPSAQPGAAEIAIAEHLEVAAHYGVGLVSIDDGERMQVCYDGDAFRRVLALGTDPLPRAQAALALTREDCVNPSLGAAERLRVDESHAAVLAGLELKGLPPMLRNRLAMRGAEVESGLAYAHVQRQRQGGAAAAARAIAALAGVAKNELNDTDLVDYNNAAMRVNASRWAAAPADAATEITIDKGWSLVVTPGQPGETCLALRAHQASAAMPATRRCTWGVVWTQSASVNREGTALAIAVQPLANWRELWLYHRGANGWQLDVLPPAAANPGLGFAEFAGWVPGGTHVLVAREARAEGRYERSFELVRLGTLAVERRAGSAQVLGAFQRWQDAAWRRDSLSLR